MSYFIITIMLYSIPCICYTIRTA